MGCRYLGCDGHDGGFAVLHLRLDDVGRLGLFLGYIFIFSRIVRRYDSEAAFLF